MHILYYSWQENTTSDFLFSMQALGHQVSPCMHELSYYFSDGVKSDIRDSCRRRLMMQSLPLTFSRLFPIWRNPFTYHISAGFLTVLTIRFILTVSATPVTIFFCLTGICASQPSGAVPGTHSIFRLPSTQHGLRNSLAFHPKAVCFVPILTCTIFHLSALSMKVPITVPSATRRTICAAIWQASLLPRRKCGESTSSRRFLLPDGSRNSSLSCPIPRRNMKC